MKAVSYTVLFAILSPGLLLLVPSVFRAVLKNPLSLLAIVLNIAFFYMALTHIKYIPYLNTLEGFQDTSNESTDNSVKSGISGEPPKDINGNKIPEMCLACAQKAQMFVQISSCDMSCSLEKSNTTECISCMGKNIPEVISKKCTNVCNKDAIASFSRAPSS